MSCWSSFWYPLLFFFGASLLGELLGALPAHWATKDKPKSPKRRFKIQPGLIPTLILLGVVLMGIFYATGSYHCSHMRYDVEFPYVGRAR